MTDKQDFLDKLKAALLDRDISETDIAPYLERFDRFYDRMVSDPQTGKADILSDIDSIADNIAAQISERYDEINRLAERTMTVERVTDVASNPESGTDGVNAAQSAVQSGEAQAVQPVQSAAKQSAIEQPATEQSMTAQPTTAQSMTAQPMAAGAKLPEYVDEEPAPNSTVFWVLFGVSLPVTIPLALAAVGLFVIVWGGLAALIIGSIAALIAVAAGGTALSLVGIIYGVIQLFSVVPVGLYEIGLGVLVGSCVMFSGILLYNFAVRLLPLVIKLVGRLFRYLFGQLKTLFGFLRRECAKL